MSLERTLSIVKPDGVEKNLIGEVVRRFESAGLRIAGARIILLAPAGRGGSTPCTRPAPFSRAWWSS